MSEFENIKVSVVLPCYNGEEFLAQSIESVLNQTHKNLELIFVNDCSTDSSLSIAESYAQKDDRVRIINNEVNKRLPESLNIGFRAAQGEYFSWTSDDNYYHEDAIEKMLKFLLENPEYTTVRAVCRVLFGGNEYFSRSNKDDISFKALLEENFFGACFLYTRKIAEKIGEYDLNTFLAEDYDYWLKMGLEGKIGTIDDILYTYRCHEKSLTSTRQADVIRVTVDLKKKFIPLYAKKFKIKGLDKMLYDTYIMDFMIDKDVKKLEGIKVPNKKAFYKFLKEQYLETGNKDYYRLIRKMGFTWAIRALCLKRKGKKLLKKNDEPICVEEKIVEEFKIEQKADLAMFKKALAWVDKYSIEGKGIAHSSKINKIYPEVSGYYIPTLINWGDRERARKYADYLVEIQNSAGSWNETENRVSYTFDTGQILKGLWEFIDEDEKYKNAFIKGCDWMLTQQRFNGSIATPDYDCWQLPYGKVIPEAIHIYCLEPIKKAGERFGNKKYLDFVDSALEFYLAQENLCEFNTLSHFNAYIIEGLIDIGEIERAQKAMDEIAKFQKEDGSVVAFAGYDYVCSTGLFQYAICWYKLGDKKRGDAAFYYALSLQNKSGGWYGAYGEGSTYFPDNEISWAVKYFLDALYWEQICTYSYCWTSFLDKVDDNDGRLKIIENTMKTINPQTVLDIGCGKGRFSHELMKTFNEAKFFGVDLSKEVLKLVSDKISKKVGTVQNLPYKAESFDFAFCVEALEHAINIKGAIKEFARILKRGGKVVIVDKNIKSLGQLQLAPWEQWFDSEELASIMIESGLEVQVVENIPYEHDDKQDGLFTAWIGTKIK